MGIDVGNPGHTDWMFVGWFFVFSGRRCLCPWLCGLRMGALWVCQALPRWLPLPVLGLVFFFCGQRCPCSRFCALQMGTFWVYQSLPWWLSLTVPGLHLKMPRSGTLQDDWLMLRLASAYALQGVQVALAWRLLGWPIRPVPVLSCLTSRGPLGPACGFYCTWVRCLDIALINFKSELGATGHRRNIFLPCSPCFIRVLSNMASQLRACRTPRNIASLGLHTFAGLQVASKGVG